VLKFDTDLRFHYLWTHTMYCHSVTRCEASCNIGLFFVTYFIFTILGHVSVQRANHNAVEIV